jgi:hypothetical protein
MVKKSSGSFLKENVLKSLVNSNIKNNLIYPHSIFEKPLYNSYDMQLVLQFLLNSVKSTFFNTASLLISFPFFFFFILSFFPYIIFEAVS